MSLFFARAVTKLLAARTVSDSILALARGFEGLQKDYGKSLEDIFYSDPPFLYLADFAKQYGSDYTSFYNDVEKAIETLTSLSYDHEETSPHDNVQDNALHLMTALRAKGKEFDAVIILDANSGIWPSQLAETEEELEQERRLFYVATTRARKQLYYVLSDRILGKHCKPTPFLREMGLDVPAASRS